MTHADVLNDILDCVCLIYTPNCFVASSTGDLYVDVTNSKPSLFDNCVYILHTTFYYFRILTCPLSHDFFFVISSHPYFLVLFLY